MNENHKQNGESTNIRPEHVTAYALGQLEGHELASIERRLAEPSQVSARQAVAETRRLAECVRAVAQNADAPAHSPQLRIAVLAQLEKQCQRPVVEPRQRTPWGRTVAWLAIGTAAAVLAAMALIPPINSVRETAQQTNSSSRIEQRLATEPHNDRRVERESWSAAKDEGLLVLPYESTQADPTSELTILNPTTEPAEDQTVQVEVNDFGTETSPKKDLFAEVGAMRGTGIAGRGEAPRGDLVRAYGGAVSRPPPSISSSNQGRPANSSGGNAVGYGRASSAGGMMAGGGQARAARPSAPSDEPFADTPVVRNPVNETRLEELEKVTELRSQINDEGWYYNNREQYEQIVENSFLAPADHPLSTFSIDVDTASYSNVRRFLMGGRLPPPAAVRIEELVNYFSYSYPQPEGSEPFSVNMETAECPWQPGHVLLRVGLKGKEIHRAERPPSNLVFLLDVSGSMADQNKLPLLKTSLLMFVAELTENDRVSIVTYAGEAGLRLPPTSGDQKAKIMQAIESLSAGGSTNGSAGIELAYEQASQYFLKEGANRVILATDGDLNVGVTSDEALVELIKNKATAGTFLTVLGFGEGNLQDAKLEKLADNGNGLYAYIDSVREGRKVLVEQMSGSTVTIAKDVKIQIEFNPREIASYRLLGYENRVLAAKDFNDDKKDAGEIGAGHTVTALYELVPVGMNQAAAAQPAGVEPLKYQRSGDTATPDSRPPTRHSRLTEAAATGELLTLKLRYKAPDGIESRLIEFPLKDRGGKFNAASKDLQFAAAVASFGMILRGSEHKGSGNLAAVSEIAGGALGDDSSGYRAEFVDLVRRAQALGAK